MAPCQHASTHNKKSLFLVLCLQPLGCPGNMASQRTLGGTCWVSQCDLHPDTDGHEVPPASDRIHTPGRER